MSDSHQEADVIKIAAIVTAVPRWAGALMAADGVPVPAAWLDIWQVGAFFMSLAMAAVEGFAISYVFNSWRNQQDKRSSLLLWLAIVMLVDFAVILTPYIVGNVSDGELAGVLGPGWLLWMWSAAVAASTGLVVGSVGYAQRDRPARAGSAARMSGQAAGESQLLANVPRYACARCGQGFATQAALNAHGPRSCQRQPVASVAVADIADVPATTGGKNGAGRRQGG
jgi:hypothetical protein